MDRTSINKARTVYYGMFASLFAFNFTKTHFDSIIEAVDVLSSRPLDEESGVALYKMKEILQDSSFETVKNESDKVFFSPTTSLIPTTASYYDEQRDDGKKRVDMMNYVLQSKFRRNTDVFKENEDHIEFISLFMQSLIQEELKGEEGADTIARDVFDNILNQMIDQLSVKLYNHENSELYKEAAIVLNTFAGFERLLLDVAEPDLSNVKNTVPHHMAPRKVKKAPRMMVDRNIDEFVSI